MNLNSVIVGGRLTRAPQVRFAPSGTAVVEFSLAINRKWHDKATSSPREETTFVDVSAFGPTADAVGEHLEKGSSAVVEGRLQLDTWDDKQTGQKRSRLKVVANHVHFGDRPAGDRRPEATSTGAPGIGHRASGAGPPTDDAPF